MTTNPVLTFDGRALKTAPSFASAISDQWYSGANHNAAVVGGLTALRAYELVPWLYRAVTLRALLVSTMPWALMKGPDEVTDDPVYASLVRGHRRRMYRTEASKVITGAGYWVNETNAVGFNVTPRWLPSPSITPRYTTDKGLTHFEFKGNYHEELIGQRNIPLERMVWFWEENYVDEVSPGVAPAAVALAAASMLHALDAFAANFFSRGGVKVTVFEIPPSTSEPDKAAFTSFLQRSVSGVRNAFKMIPVRGGVKPTVIGSDVKDTQATELTLQQRDAVAVALGVPPTVIDGKSANFATADSEMTGFYLHTIIPEAELLFERANELLFERLGLEIVAKPEELEVMQALQLQQVNAVTEAVGKPVLLEWEGRELLGYNTREESEKAHEDKLRELGLYQEPAPAPVPAAPVPVPPEETEQTNLDETDFKRIKKVMGEWRKAAIEDLRVGITPGQEYEADDIEYVEAMAIYDALEQCKTPAAVRAVFTRHWPKPGRKDAPMPAYDPQLERFITMLDAATKALAVAPASLPQIINQMHLDPAPLAQAIKDVGAPQIVVNVPEQAAPVVNVATAAPVVNVQPAPVVNEVTVNTPRIKGTHAAIKRDGQGNAAGTETTYEYAKD